MTAAIDGHAVVEHFATNPVGGEGRIVCVDGEVVRLYVFASGHDRAAAEAAIDPNDPSHVGSAIVEWIGQPRFWSVSHALVSYSGASEGLVSDLREGFGAPFATAQGSPVPRESC